MNTAATSNTYKKRRVAETALEVTELGLGGATIGGIFNAVPDEQARATVQHAFDAGINYVDTAPFYGFGRSEHLVGDVLREQRAGKVVSTKVGRTYKGLKPGETQERFMWSNPLPFKETWDFTYDGIVRSFEDSQLRLGTNEIDILYVHDIGVKTHGEEKNKPLWEQLTKGGYQALLDLKKAGLVKAIGLGVNDWEVLMEAFGLGDWDVFLLAGRYTLLEQTSLSPFLETCVKRKASVVVGGPFNSGILVGGVIHNYKEAPADIVAKVNKIKDVCAKYDVPLPAAAIQFPLAHQAIAAMIPGPKSPGELDGILGWFNTPIPDELWDDLAKEGLIAPGSPLPNGRVAG